MARDQGSVLARPFSHCVTSISLLLVDATGVFFPCFVGCMRADEEKIHSCFSTFFWFIFSADLLPSFFATFSRFGFVEVCCLLLLCFFERFFADVFLEMSVELAIFTSHLITYLIFVRHNCKFPHSCPIRLSILKLILFGNTSSIPF